MYNTVTNEGKEDQTLEYISSFSYWGIEKEQKEGIPELVSSDDKMSMVVVHNGWQKELTVKKYRFADLGMAQTQPHNYQRTSKTIEITNTGNWSAKEYVPMGYIGNSAADSSLFFEIDHSGSWHYEIGDQNCHFYLAVSGPTEIQSHWSKNLKPGDSFTTVPVAVGVGHDDFEEAIGTLTKYRRKIRRPNKDNENLPVIFNDYMNCLFGDPTTEKEFPLVDAAEKAGCEYFVIDAGWYADGNWWDSVGEWQESKKRFPNGVREVTDYIRSKGMIPGVWLELEVMGINCKKASILPDECFFLRHGKRVYDRSRYQLDFRHPLVIEHVTEVIDVWYGTTVSAISRWTTILSLVLARKWMRTVLETVFWSMRERIWHGWMASTKSIRILSLRTARAAVFGWTMRCWRETAFSRRAIRRITAIMRRSRRMQPSA